MKHEDSYPARCFPQGNALAGLLTRLPWIRFLGVFDWNRQKEYGGTTKPEIEISLFPAKKVLPWAGKLSRQELPGSLVPFPRRSPRLFPLGAEQRRAEAFPKDYRYDVIDICG